MASIIFSKEQELCFFLPSGEGGLERIAKKVARDIRETTGSRVAFCRSLEPCKQAVLPLLPEDALAKELEKAYPFLKEVKGRRESFGLLLCANPAEGVEEALLVYGSEKISLFYGLFYISELLGVSPALFWGDCAYPHYQRAVFYDEEGAVKDEGENSKLVFLPPFLSKEPSVEYRGFFINDEWPCFGSWATEHFGGFHAQMYDHVFEYLLRMKGNYIWPAMWTSSFMEDGPGLASMELADAYGIYVGMSHHEPCMRSGEEYSHVRGKGSLYGDDWSYERNTKGIVRFWEDGLKRSQGHRVFPTIGMRGERDSKMLGEEADLLENVRQLKEIILKQRELMGACLEKTNPKLPLLFAVYKEVEDYYFGEGQKGGLAGFEALRDVTLLLCEDNFGHMRSLPGEEERDHPGGFGMYYHLDYHGDPISYEWVASTPLSKIWEQMTQAYAYGIRKLWIVNAGDVKFQEYPLGYFMALAYDFEGLGGADTTGLYTKQWLETIFGPFVKHPGEGEAIQEVLEGYIRLNGLRRPESCNDRVYHPAHYREADRMLALVQELENKNEALYQELSKTRAGDCYYSMIYFPAAASLNVLKMHLYAGKNHLYSAQGKAAANTMGERMTECIQKDRRLAVEFGNFKEGKWRGMELASHIGFTNWNEEDSRYPVNHVLTLPLKPRLVVSRADGTEHFTNQYFPIPLILEDFALSEASSLCLQIANGGEGRLQWETDLHCSWLCCSKTKGSTEEQEEILLTVDKSSFIYGQVYECSFHIKAGTESVPVQVRAARRDFRRVPPGTCIPENRIYALGACRYQEKQGGIWQGKRAEFQKLTDFGKYGSAMKVFPPTASFSHIQEAPSLTYGFWGEEAGEYFLEIRTSPANPLVFGGSLGFWALVNGEELFNLDTLGEGYKAGEAKSLAWCEGVLAQEHRARVKIWLKKGMNRIQLMAREAGAALERIYLYPLEGACIKPSYLGPEKDTVYREGEMA